MRKTNDPCPYEPRMRAERCETCCDTNGALTPCVLAWRNLQMKVVSIDVYRRALKRAA